MEAHHRVQEDRRSAGGTKVSPVGNTGAALTPDLPTEISSPSTRTSERALPQAPHQNIVIFNRLSASPFATGGGHSMPSGPWLVVLAVMISSWLSSFD